MDLWQNPYTGKKLRIETEFDAEIVRRGLRLGHAAGGCNS